VDASVSTGAATGNSETGALGDGGLGEGVESGAETGRGGGRRKGGNSGAETGDDGLGVGMFVDTGSKAGAGESTSGVDANS
jgi:hypothetical protein